MIRKHRMGPARAIGVYGQDILRVPNQVIQSGVKMRTVPCAECKAEVGQPCVSSNGKVRTHGHVSRVRIATRAHNAAKGLS